MSRSLKFGSRGLRHEVAGVPSTAGRNWEAAVRFGASTRPLNLDAISVVSTRVVIPMKYSVKEVAQIVSLSIARAKCPFHPIRTELDGDPRAGWRSAARADETSNTRFVTIAVRTDDGEAPEEER